MSHHDSTHEQAPHTSKRPLAWLDRLAVAVPGYGGYDRRSHRRETAFALRDAIHRRLSTLHRLIENCKADCQRREADREIASLDRVEAHLDRILDRLEGFGGHSIAFYDAPDLDSRRVEPVHGADMMLLRLADRLVEHYEHPQPTHNLLAEVEEQLREFEVVLDGRALMLHGLNATEG